MDQRRHLSQFSNPTMAASSFSEELRLPTEVIICNCKIAAPVPIFSIFGLFAMVSDDLFEFFVIATFHFVT